MASADGLDGALQCPCDCGKFLSTCDCETASSARSFVSGLRDSGKSDGEIAEAYAASFGGSYVNFVPKEGRGLSLWLLPPAGVIVGAAAVYYRLKRDDRRPLPTGAGSRVSLSCGECGHSVNAESSFCPSCGSEVDMNACGSCGELLGKDEAFCTGCGSPVVSGCPSCGESADPGSTFCSSCGEPL